MKYQKTLSLLMFGYSAAWTCQQMDPDMRPCLDDSSQCCYETEPGLNLAGSGYSRYANSFLGTRMDQWQYSRQAIKVENDGTIYSWMRDEFYDNLKEELLTTVCDCAFNRCGCSDDEQCCGDEPKPQLPTTVNSANPRFSTRALNALTRHSDYVVSKLICDKCYQDVSFSSSGVKIAYNTESPCDQFPEATCEFTCVNAKTFSAICDCDSGWVVEMSDLASFCTDGCNSFDNSCSSNPSWIDERGWTYIRGSGCSGDTCYVYCVHGESQGTPKAVCNCNNRWTVSNSGCQKCASTAEKCAYQPTWYSNNMIVASGTCSQNDPGDQCAISCAASSGSSVATCSCDGKWYASVSHCGVSGDDNQNDENDDWNHNDENDDDNKNPACFPGEAQVLTRNAGYLAMSELGLFDEVAYYDPTLDDVSYTPVLAFVPRLPDDVANFRVITMRTGHSLTATSGHLVKLVDGRDLPIAALQPGDKLRTYDGVDVISSITTINTTGLYAPVTRAGTLFVDGVHVSSFGRDVGVTEQSVYLALLACAHSLVPTSLKLARHALGSRFLRDTYVQIKTAVGQMSAL